jgi:hypothetical protein
MRIQHRCIHRLAVAAAMMSVWCPALSGLAQPPAAPTIAPQRDIAAVEEDAEAAVGDISALPGVAGIQTVHLRRDGTLAGRVSLLDAAGEVRGTAARIKFIGHATATTASDDDGDYSVDKLKPGIYAVLAASEEKSNVSTIRVLPFDENAPPEQLTLPLPLVLPTDSPFVQQLMGCAGVWDPAGLGPAAFAPGMAPAPVGTAPGAFGGAAGGAMGGGGGLGAALGLGAMGAGIGLGSLGNDDNGNPPPATPFEP